MFPNAFLVTSLLTLFCFITFNHARNLPPFIKPCRRADPNLERCVIKMIEGIRPQLAKGIPEMRIPPLDPFRVPLITLDQGTRSVNFQAKFENITAYGGQNFNISKLKFDWDAPSISVDVSFPLIRTEADYDINGKVMVVPVNGKGKSNGTFSDIHASVTVFGKFEQRHNKTYMVAKTRKVQLKLGGLQLYLDNLFNGNKQLSDQTNAFINENWRDIIQEVQPLVEDTVGEMLLQLSKGMLDLYALEDLFPLDRLQQKKLT